jgi:hypothetical protein
MNIDLEMKSCPGCGAPIVKEDEAPSTGEGLRFRAVIISSTERYECIVRWDHDTLPTPLEVKDKLEEGALWVEPGEMLWIEPRDIDSVRVGHLLVGACMKCGSKLTEMCPACKE